MYPPLSHLKTDRIYKILVDYIWNPALFSVILITIAKKRVGSFL